MKTFLFKWQIWCRWQRINIYSPSLSRSCHLSSEEASRAGSQQASQYPSGDGRFMAAAGQQEHRSPVPQQVDPPPTHTQFSAQLLLLLLALF